MMPQQSTIDEPVLQTIMRDLKMIGYKLYHILIPRGKAANALRDWDLWGPLLLCLVLAVILSLTRGEDARALVFALVFVVIWAGAAIVTVNAQLLGGNLSFFQCVCVLGYCVFPLTISAIIVFFIQHTSMAIKLPITAVTYAWSVYSSYGFLSGTVPDSRKILAVYPVLLFYLVIAYFVVTQKDVPSN